MTLRTCIIRAMSAAIGLTASPLKPELQAEAAFEAALEVIKQFRKEG